ncbi:hypothetical protein Cgig2_012689 [Carnegiea gigantea]|uniref:Uncharacterized protein n=1 Tax=Carnegiea gigantea TaxID=171969 RepID=A0A9Q1QA73_9CARY|nr:hypothetical protein Cgig2_012689 [Carnegiea gigantea]
MGGGGRLEGLVDGWGSVVVATPGCRIQRLAGAGQGIWVWMKEFAWQSSTEDQHVTKYNFICKIYWEVLIVTTRTNEQSQLKNLLAVHEYWSKLRTSVAPKLIRGLMKTRGHPRVDEDKMAVFKLVSELGMMVGCGDNESDGFQTLSCVLGLQEDCGMIYWTSTCVLKLCPSICQNRSSSTHFRFPEALDAVKRICPKRALLTGMTHDYDHEKINMYLCEWSERY